jgi:hypothetical protein
MQVQTVAMYQARVTDEGGASGVLSPVLLQRCNWESTTLVHQAQSSLHHFTWPLMVYISTSLSHASLGSVLTLTWRCFLAPLFQRVIRSSSAAVHHEALLPLFPTRGPRSGLCHCELIVSRPERGQSSDLVAG